MRIALFGQFGGGNSGNDGSLEAMIGFLRQARPDAELVCICPNPAQVTADFGISAIASGRTAAAGRVFTTIDRLLLRLPGRMLNLAYPFSRMRGIDVMIVPGTGFLDDFQEAPLGWPFMIFRWSLAARIVGARLAFVSIGAGPIRRRLSRWFMITAARLCHYRSYRDEESLAFMRDLGCTEEDAGVYPDLAFRLPVPGVDPKLRSSSIRVGVGVMAYSGWVRGVADAEAVYRTYLGKLVDFIRWLIDEGYEVRLLTGDQQDEKPLGDILNALGEPAQAGRAPVTARKTRTLGGLMREIAKTDVVVASRFHNIVCALKLARPTISLGYARKNAALLEDMDIEGFSQHIEALDLDLLKSQFRQALGERRLIEDRMRRASARYALRLAEQEKVLLELLSACQGAEALPVPSRLAG